LRLLGNFADARPGVFFARDGLLARRRGFFLGRRLFTEVLRWAYTGFGRGSALGLRRRAAKKNCGAKSGDKPTMTASQWDLLKSAPNMDARQKND
jgi:hypothetical protein